MVREVWVDDILLNCDVLCFETFVWMGQRSALSFDMDRLSTAPLLAFTCFG